MAIVFLSFAADDAETTEHRDLILRYLTEHGHDVVLPPGDVGESQAEAERRDLRRADVAVFLLSIKSLQSPIIMRQAQAAAQLHAERQTPLLVPQLVGQVAFEDVPAPLNRYRLLRAERPQDLMPQFGTVFERLEAKQAARALTQAEERKRLKETAASYINQSLETLRDDAKRYRFEGRRWYAIALFVLALGASLAALLVQYPVARTDSPWVALGHGLALLAAAGFLSGIARLAFVLGKSNMVEAHRHSNRVHAIRFGEFYLKAFPERATWPEAKEALQHWNIDSGSAFQTQSAADVDPQLIGKLLDFVRSLKSAG